MDSSLMAILRALATCAEVRSFGSRRKSGTCETDPRAARRLSLALAPANALDPGRNASVGARMQVHMTAHAANAATETFIVK
jgi:hypothetical protein